MWAIILITVTEIINIILSFLDILPSMPPSLISIFDEFKEILMLGLDGLNFFIPINFLAIVVPIAIAIQNAEHIYNGVMWVIHKIPFVSVE